MPPEFSASKLVEILSTVWKNLDGDSNHDTQTISSFFRKLSPDVLKAWERDPDYDKDLLPLIALAWGQVAVRFRKLEKKDLSIGPIAKFFRDHNVVFPDKLKKSSTTCLERAKKRWLDQGEPRVAQTMQSKTIKPPAPPASSELTDVLARMVPNPSLLEHLSSVSSPRKELWDGVGGVPQIYSCDEYHDGQPYTSGDLTDILLERWEVSWKDFRCFLDGSETLKSKKTMRKHISDFLDGRSYGKSMDLTIAAQLPLRDQHDKIKIPKTGLFVPETSALVILASLEGAFTDLHIDGTEDILSAVVGESGCKMFMMWPGTKKNLAIFAEISDLHPAVKEAEKLEGGVYYPLGDGQAVEIPALTLHAVLTINHCFLVSKSFHHATSVKNATRYIMFRGGELHKNDKNLKEAVETWIRLSKFTTDATLVVDCFAEIAPLFFGGPEAVQARLGTFWCSGLPQLKGRLEMPEKTRKKLASTVLTALTNNNFMKLMSPQQMVLLRQIEEWARPSRGEPQKRAGSSSGGTAKRKRRNVTSPYLAPEKGLG